MAGATPAHLHHGPMVRPAWGRVCLQEGDVTGHQRGHKDGEALLQWQGRKDLRGTLHNCEACNLSNQSFSYL